MSRKAFQWSLWGWPIVMAALSAVGLGSAFLGDGLWDWVSWIGLGIPAAACLWFGWRRRASSST